MSYLQGPGGLVEQRSGEATSYPLADAHGDITTILDGAAEVTSRQAWDPWGVQLNGPGLEMGWLGAQQRRSDPATGLTQMGVRPYGPEFGSFIAEDPVLGHVGRGVTMNRYPYAWNDPMNRYDLAGRDVCAPTPWGPACASDAEEGVVEITKEIEEGWGIAKEGLEEVRGASTSVADAAWDWTAPGRGFVAERARGFWKKHGDTVEPIYNFAAEHWQECRDGARAGAPGGAAIGAFAGPQAIAPGALAGGTIGCVGTAGAYELLGP